jgi:uncharacterized protein YndB with AHSA1/START domain
MTQEVTTMNAPNPVRGREDLTLTIARTFEAPRALVFAAWTDPAHLAKWWGPRGYVLQSCEVEARPGGAYRFCIRSPEGRDNRMWGSYREVVPPERLVLAGSWVDADGTPIGPTSVLTLIFEDLGGRTRLTLHNAIFESEEARDLHYRGWNSSLDRLAEYLAAA